MKNRVLRICNEKRPQNEQTKVLTGDLGYSELYKVDQGGKMRAKRI